MKTKILSTQTQSSSSLQSGVTGGVLDGRCAHQWLRCMCQAVRAEILALTCSSICKQRHGFSMQIDRFLLTTRFLAEIALHFSCSGDPNGVLRYGPPDNLQARVGRTCHQHLCPSRKGDHPTPPHPNVTKDFKSADSYEHFRDPAPKTKPTCWRACCHFACAKIGSTFALLASYRCSTCGPAPKHVGLQTANILQVCEVRSWKDAFLDIHVSQVVPPNGPTAFEHIQGFACILPAPCSNSRQNASRYFCLCFRSKTCKMNRSFVTNVLCGCTSFCQHSRPTSDNSTLPCNDFGFAECSRMGWRVSAQFEGHLRTYRCQRTSTVVLGDSGFRFEV